MPTSSYRSKWARAQLLATSTQDVVKDHADKSHEVAGTLKSAATTLIDAIEAIGAAVILARDDDTVPADIKALLNGTSIRDLSTAPVDRLAIRLAMLTRVLAAAYVQAATDRDILGDGLDATYEDLLMAMNNLNSLPADRDPAESVVQATGPRL